jgi:hypothetical protein
MNLLYLLQNICKSKNGYLVEITSKSEGIFVNSMMDLYDGKLNVLTE